MRFRTHLAFGFLLFFIIDYYLSFNNKLVGAVLVLFFSILPDLDLHTSYIGNRVKVFSYFFEIVLKHRGLLHSLWIPIILYLLLLNTGYEYTVLGYAGHLFLDALNKKGLRLFWPFYNIKGWFRTGGIVDIGLFCASLVLDVMFLVPYILS